MIYLKELLNNYGISFLHTILVTILSYTSLEIKKIYQSHIHEKIKKEVIIMVYHAIEEFNPNLSYEQKLNKMIINSEQILNEKNIKMTPLELKIYILSTIHIMKGDEVV